MSVGCRLMMDRFQFFYCGENAVTVSGACLWCTSLLRVSPGAVLLGVLLSSLKSLQAVLRSGGAGREALLRAAAAACLIRLGLSFWSFWWPVLGESWGLNLHCHGE